MVLLLLISEAGIIAQTRSDFSFLVDFFHGFSVVKSHRHGKYFHNSTPEMIYYYIRNTIFYHKNMFVITEVIILKGRGPIPLYYIIPPYLLHASECVSIKTQFCLLNYYAQVSPANVISNIQIYYIVPKSRLDKYIHRFPRHTTVYRFDLSVPILLHIMVDGKFFLAKINNAIIFDLQFRNIRFRPCNNIENIISNS